MPRELSQEDLALLGVDAFSVFGDYPDEWPDIVQINRSGVTDFNVRGIWSLEERIEFFHVDLHDLKILGSSPIPTRPESTGDAA